MRDTRQSISRIVTIASIAVPALLVCSCSKKVEEPATSDFVAASAATLPPGPETLEKVDVTVGTGAEAKTGDKVKVHYTGTLMNGKQFDSSVGKAPFEFTLGKGNVIKGWDEGVPGMRVGGKRKLTIPWQMAYGEAGSGDKIPAKAALKFDVELLEIVGADGGAAAPKDAGTTIAAKAIPTMEKDLAKPDDKAKGKTHEKK